MTFARSSRDAGEITPRSTPPPPPRRRTGFARLVGALGLVGLTAILYWVLTDEAFTVTEERVSFAGLVHADEAEVREHLTDIQRGPNVFRVRASEIVGELSTLTEVDAASARVTLPADVSVALDERNPVFIWSDGAVGWLVDEEGMLFAPAEIEAATADATVEDAARERLPVVKDERLPETPPTVGTYLPPLDLAVMRQLLALDEEELGERAGAVSLRIDDRDGYVLESLDGNWQALFGRYTLTILPPEIIPRQVQCLHWLLEHGVRNLEGVRLVVSEGECGTFTTFGDKAAKGG